jgi:hypothetical protein
MLTEAEEQDVEKSSQHSGEPAAERPTTPVEELRVEFIPVEEMI